MAKVALKVFLFLSITVSLFLIFSHEAKADTITISTPASYRVFQRGPSNTANINISGTYSGSPTAIEAQWNNGNWTTISSSPTGGTYSGTLSNQSAGQGTLTVRYTNNTSVSASSSYVGVGDIFVIAGQSNAEGSGRNNQSYSHATLKASLFGNDDVWKEMIDPTDSNTSQVDSVSSDSAAGGSTWPLLATLFLQNQSVPVAFVPAAKGGTLISQWQRSSSNPTDTATLYGSMSRRITAVGGVKAVLFFQGEGDAQVRTSSSTYQSLLNQMINDINNDFGVKTVIAQIANGISDTSNSSYVSDSTLDTFRTTQWTVCTSNSHAVCGPVLYDIDLTDEGGDSLHLKTDLELKTEANRWWAAVNKEFYGGPDGRGPRFSKAEYNSTKNQVTITFTDETLPIVLPISLGGITIKDNGTSVGFSSVQRMSSNQIKVYLNQAATGDITVSIAEGRTGVNGVPTDSSEFSLPAEISLNNSTSLLSTSSSSNSSNSSNSSQTSTPTPNITPIKLNSSSNSESEKNNPITTEETGENNKIVKIINQIKTTSSNLSQNGPLVGATAGLLVILVILIII